MDIIYNIKSRFRWKLLYVKTWYSYHCDPQWSSYSKNFISNSRTPSIVPALDIKKLAIVGKILWSCDIILLLCRQATLAKWLSVRLRTKWLCIRVLLQSLKLQIYIAPFSCKVFLDIQATTECRFTLKRLCPLLIWLIHLLFH